MSPSPLNQLAALTQSLISLSAFLIHFKPTHPDYKNQVKQLRDVKRQIVDFDPMLAACIHEGIVAEMQSRARSAGIQAVHAVMDGFGYGLTIGEVTLVKYVGPLYPVVNFPDSRASMACLADALYAVEHEMRQRNHVCFDPKRVAVLSDGIAFGVDADPTVVASAFAWATHSVSSIVCFEAADQVEDAWNEMGMHQEGIDAFDWLARWANKPMTSGIRPRFLPKEAIVQLARAAFREHKAARA